MKQTGICAGLAMLMFLPELNGQIAKPPASGAAIVTVGCINRAEQNGSSAGAPGVPPATSASAPTLANSQELTGVLVLNGATAANVTKDTERQAAAGGAVRQAPVTYVLNGLREELDRHVGQQVEVTGTLRMVEEGPATIQNTVGHIEVASVKMLAVSCPKPTGAEPKK